MTDQPSPDQPKDGPVGSAMPPPTETFQFPFQLLEQWVEIPASERVVPALTKQDFDHLLFGLLRVIEAQGKLDQTLVAWSNNDLAAANAMLADFRRLNAESQNHIRQFFSGLMISGLASRQTNAGA